MARGFAKQGRRGRGHQQARGAVALAAAAVFTLALTAATPAQAAKRGDFNGDGRVDLAIGVPNDDVFFISDQANAGAVNVLHGAPGGIDPASDGDVYLTQATANNIPGAQENFGNALAAGDFDGDKRSDLAVGVPSDDISMQESAGSMNVFYGGDAGLTGTGAQLLHQDTAGVAEQAESFDWFGIEVASGDFDGDGFDDLAVCAVQDDVATSLTDGAVTVLYGGVSGLSGAGSQLLTQDTPGLKGEVQGGERFGESMTAGDFDGDKLDDLAIGSPNEDAGGGAINHAGAVNVVYGSGTGLTTDGNELLQQGSKRLKGAAEEEDVFGRGGLAAGDAQRDGFDDLAVGIPGENGGFDGKGAVHFLRGSGKGLLRPRDRILTQNTKGIPSKPKPGEDFGRALAFGDFTGDKLADLAIGVTETLKGVAGDGHGAVNVVFGARRGLSAKGAELWSQATKGVMGAPADNDFFGMELAAGNFDGKRAADLAIGVSEDPGGAVNVLYSRSGGLKAKGDALFDQGSAGITDDPETNDGFGRNLTPP